jgi:DNA-binding NtrC family response regulator
MASAPTPCVLIVDDDDDLRRTFSQLFGKDYCVFDASSGQEALSLLKIKTPQLMLLDLSMPGMDGLEVLKAVKALHRFLPVIMLTSERDSETARVALSLGAVQFITKPFDIDYLRDEMQRILGAAGDGAKQQDSSGRPWKLQL